MSLKDIILIEKSWKHLGQWWNWPNVFQKLSVAETSTGLKRLTYWCFTLFFMQRIKSINWEMKTLWQNYEQFILFPKILFNSFPDIDAFGRLCNRWLFENMATKEEIVQNEQFLLLPVCWKGLRMITTFGSRKLLTLSLIRQFCSRRLWICFVKK